MSIQFLNSCKRCHCWSNIIQTFLGHRLCSDVFLEWCCWHTTVHARIAIGWQGVVCATSIVSAALWRIRAKENRPRILYIFQTIFSILQSKWNSSVVLCSIFATKNCDFSSVLYTHLGVDDEMFWSILVTEVQRLTHRWYFNHKALWKGLSDNLFTR